MRQYLHRCLILVDEVRRKDMMLQPAAERFQHLGIFQQPLRQGLPVYLEAFPLEYVLLPVKRQLVGIFGHHDLGYQARGCHQGVGNRVVEPGYDVFLIIIPVRLKVVQLVSGKKMALDIVSLGLYADLVDDAVFGTDVSVAVGIDIGIVCTVGVVDDDDRGIGRQLLHIVGYVAVMCLYSDLLSIFLRKWGAEYLQLVEKVSCLLRCGDEGLGRLEAQDLLQVVYPGG